MLRYADAIVKRGVDKLIDAIGHSPEPQTKNAEKPQPQKRMSNDTDCVGPLAERESTDALRRTVFGRWLCCMVAGWVPATAILLKTKHTVRVCLEALLFLCPFVLMFSALAADFITHKQLIVGRIDDV